MNAHDQTQPAADILRGRTAKWRLAALVALAVGVTGSSAHAQYAYGQALPPGASPPQQIGAASAPPAAVKPVAPRPRPLAQRPGAPVANGCGSAGALGVSRVQEIDTSTGPKFGHQQYKDLDFLNDGEIVLTFDDGPLRPYTMPVLRALDAHCTKATFFMVGRMALSDPAIVKDMARRGHTIGTHTWSHVDLRKTAPSRARGEMELGISAVSRALGKPVAPFFRFPYLSAPQTMVSYAGTRKLAVFSIEVDANDYRTKDAATVQRAVLDQLHETKKGIILFHDIQASTAGAIKGLLDELKARGFKVVHLVPKGAAMTLPEFDAMAEKEMNRKSEIASADPLASRSVVWPVSGGKQPGPGAFPAGEVLPWGVTAVRPEPAGPPPAPKPKPIAKPRDDDDWAIKLFRF